MRLLWWPLLAVLVASALYDYRNALSRARDNQDLALSRVAIALASRLDVDADDARDDDMGQHLKRTMDALQRADGQDRQFFLVRGGTGDVIGGDPAMAVLAQAQAGQPGFADRQWQSRDVRVVTYPHRSPLGPVTVVVAETTERRQAQARQVLIDTVVPNLVLLLLALGLVRVGVGLAMKPLDEVSHSVSQRSSDDLSPVSFSALPGEVLPLVEAMNRLMANLRMAAQSQQMFLSNAAHQLRTPLAGVQTQVELAMASADSAQRERLSAIQRALQRMGRSTHQMLALARSGPQAAAAEAFDTLDLPLLLEDAASQWLDTALAAGVDLGFDTQPARLHGSPWMLQELVSNLIHNAIRHTPRGGRVTARCGAAPEGGCFLLVEDDGPGIPEAERDKVFDRFYQAPGAARGGSGLGLSIVREVALRHDATVQLRAGSDGHGLSVRVHFRHGA